MKNVITLGIVGGVLLLVFSVFMWRMNVIKTYNQKVNSYEAMRQKEAAFHDELWKSLAGMAQVDQANDEMQKKLFETWEDAISQTASHSTNSTGSFVPILFQQAGVQLDNTIKLKLVQAVDDKNAEFTLRRNDIIASCNELNNYITNPWNSMWLPSTIKIECKIITSSRTQKASETGKDDEGGNIYNNPSKEGTSSEKN